MRRWVPGRGTLLVFAPHPDDESLGAGGVLALSSKAVVAFATDGEAGAPCALRGRRLAALRRREARAACRVLGAEGEFWGLHDGGLKGEGGLALRAAASLEKWMPRVVLAPDARDPHPDHRALARAVASAVSALPARRRPRVLAYEVTGSVRPDLAADVSRAMSRKLRALACHRTQEGAHRWTAFSERRARARALWLKDAEFAEVFRAVPAPKSRRRA